MELGNQSEFLGVMNAQEMLATFFTHDGGDTGKWRLKGHGKVKFWEWMATWAICIRNPSDIGFDGSRYELPPLNIIEHVVSGGELDDGQLFAVTAQTLSERRQAKRNSMDERIDLAKQIANSIDGPVITWCHMNEEGDLLEKTISGSRQVKGSMTDEAKEDVLQSFGKGELRTLITKPKIGCWGLNWQHCSDVFTFPSHSFEQYYQAVRRCWRFGQKRPVTVNIIATEGEAGVAKNLRRKADQADQMFAKLVEYMTDELRIGSAESFSNQEEIPSWLQTTKILQTDTLSTMATAAK
jgi:hypothetical protein